jgi:arsenate reductase
MAEAFLNQSCPNFFEAHSAGLEPGTLNPLVVEVMREIGLDLSGNRTKSVADMIQSGQHFDYVITVCDGASAERCPVFPGNTARLHWSFPDPSSLNGSHEERLARTREIRDAIQHQVRQWCDESCVCPAKQTD